MRLLRAAIPFIVGVSALRVPQLSARDDDIESTADIEPAGSIDGLGKCHCPPARTVTKTVTVRAEGGHAPTSTAGSMRPWTPEPEKTRGGDGSKKQPVPTQKPDTPRPSRPGSGGSRGGQNRNVVYFTNW
jgi:hypothetical protein